MPAVQKEFFDRMATEEERLHREAYPWYKYEPAKNKDNAADDDEDNAKVKKVRISEMKLPGYHNMGDLMREYHQFLRSNGLSIMYPIPADAPESLSQYDVPEYYSTILVDPTEIERKKRKRPSLHQSQKAQKTHQNQSPQAAVAAAAQTASFTPPQRQVGQPHQEQI